MHFHFNFTAIEVLWTLTFAAQLVLLVVLMGRDRLQRFPWFTASIVVVGLRLLTSRLLFSRLDPIAFNSILISLLDLAVLANFMVLVELARHAFGGVRRRNRAVWVLILLAVGAVVLRFWGAWPAWTTLTAESDQKALAFMQLGAQKGALLVNVLTVALGLLIVLFGRSRRAGWRSHTQQIMIGLSTAAIAQLAVQGILQEIFAHAAPHSQADVDRILGLRDKIYNANNVIYLVVIAWWIACLWIDEPGTAPAAEAQADEAADETALEIESGAATAEAPQQIESLPRTEEQDGEL
jgi:hypothetical protein